MIPIRSGDLRRRITLQSRDLTVDAYGGQATTWSDVATVWAAIEPSGGRELLSAQAMQIDQPVTVTMRWQSIFDDPKAVAAMRFVYRGRYFNIHGVANESERDRVLTLIASEGLNKG